LTALIFPVSVTIPVPRSSVKYSVFPKFICNSHFLAFFYQFPQHTRIFSLLSILCAYHLVVRKEEVVQMVVLVDRQSHSNNLEKPIIYLTVHP
jgi:hypothetical protein